MGEESSLHRNNGQESQVDSKMGQEGQGERTVIVEQNKPPTKPSQLNKENKQNK